MQWGEEGDSGIGTWPGISLWLLWPLGERNGSTRRGGHALDYLVNLAPLLDKTSLLKSMLCATRFPLTIQLGSLNLERIAWNLGSLGNPLFRAKRSIFENVGVPEIRKGIASNSFLFLPHPWEKGSVVALEEHRPDFRDSGACSAGTICWSLGACRNSWGLLRNWMK